MKKILLLFAAMICAVAGWAQDATVSATVKGQKLEVALTNTTEEFVAFQMDITLPGGVTVDADDAVELVAARLTQPGTPSAIDANETVNFIIAYNKINETTVRVIAYNLQNRAIAGTKGALFTMDFAGTPDANFVLDNVLFVTTSGLNEIKLQLAESVPGTTFKPGDVTGEGIVNVDDVLATIELVFGRTDGVAEGWNLEAADPIKTTGPKYTIDDVLAIIDTIFGR